MRLSIRALLPALALAAAGCEIAASSPTAEPSICVAPVAAAGAACAVDWECPDGTSCFDGSCRDLGGDGEPCARQSDCAAELLCSCDSTDCGDRVDTCHAPATRSLDEPCYADASCSEGVCNWTLGYVCAVPGGEGQTCLDQSDCGEGLSCNWALDPHECALPAPEGEPCIYDRDCAEGLACVWPTGDASGAPKVCAARAFSVGDACDSNTCGQELFCEATTLSCTFPAPLGAPCEGGCEMGLSCNYGVADGLCVALASVAAGDPCSETAHCQEGLLCTDDICREPGFLGAGQACRDDAECGENLRCGFEPAGERVDG